MEDSVGRGRMVDAKKSWREKPVRRSSSASQLWQLSALSVCGNRRRRSGSREVERPCLINASKACRIASWQQFPKCYIERIRRVRPQVTNIQFSKRFCRTFTVYDKCFWIICTIEHLYLFNTNNAARQFSRIMSARRQTGDVRNMPATVFSSARWNEFICRNYIRIL